MDLLARGQMREGVARSCCLTLLTETVSGEGAWY